MKNNVVKEINKAAEKRGRNMKRILLVAFLALMFVTIIPKISLATTYTFQPNPTDLYDLDHSRFYAWGFDLNLPNNEEIIGASLFVDNINNNMEPEANDIVYARLLNWAPLGVHSAWDGQGGGDNLADYGILLGTYSDNNWFYHRHYPGGPLHFHNPSRDINHDLGPWQVRVLRRFAEDGRIGLGFDPDCHYNNDGIYFNLETKVIPEPTTMSLLGLGLLGLAGLRKRRV